MIVNNVNDEGLMKNSKFPCKDCPDRKPGSGCHDTCEKYQKRLEEFRKRKKNLRDDWITTYKPYANMQFHNRAKV